MECKRWKLLSDEAMVAQAPQARHAMELLGLDTGEVDALYRCCSSLSKSGRCEQKREWDSKKG